MDFMCRRIHSCAALTKPSIDLLSAGMELLTEFEVGWRDVDAAVTRFLRLVHGVDAGSFTSDEYTHLYTTVNNLCHSPREYKKQLHERYKKTLQDYTKLVLDSLKEKQSECLLKEFAREWKNHKLFVHWFSKFFAPLDQYYTEPNVLMPVRELGISCFFDMVFDHLKTKLATIVIELINGERDGMFIDHALVKEVLYIFVEIGRGGLGAYKLYFEHPFRKSSADYYSRMALTWMLQDTCALFMLKAEECLQKEKQRVANYLHPSTESKLLEDILFEVVSRLYREKSECKLLLLHGQTNDLSRMFSLFSKLEGGLFQLAKILKEHVDEVRISLLNDLTRAANNREDFVWKAMELHERLLSYVKNSFENHATFHKALKEAFELFWLKDIAGCSGVESLASFCDVVLQKGGNEKPSFEELEEILNKVVYMLRYIGDKDVFVEFLREKLGKRLILNKSDYSYELSFISKLRLNLDIGKNCIIKMSMMLSEIMAAKNHQEYFGNFSPTVLKAAIWPSYETFELQLPAEMAECVQPCEKYYRSKVPPKKLTWIYSFGECTITANFEAKTMELIVNACQAALLLLFNEADSLSCSAIATQLQLPNDMVVSLLKSLSFGKYNILEKEPKNKMISIRDTFQFNHKFTHKLDIIKVPLPRTKKKETVVDDVHRNRKYSIDACLVRIMKTRKVMSHQELVEECAKKLTLSFKPDTRQIKKRIEVLIERQYLQRDPEDGNSYQYIP